MMQDRSDRSPKLALLSLFPSAALAFPVLLADDPLPHAAGTGWALLFALPLALALPLCGRRGLPKLALLWLPLVALTLLARFVPSAVNTVAVDGFELRRATLLSFVSLTAMLAGSAFGPGAVRLFQRGAILVSLAYTLQALYSADATGPLGNTGVLSQVALPGAVIGALVGRRESRLFALLGGAAAVLFAIHATTTPVLAGALAFCTALLVAAWFRRGAPGFEAGRLAAFAALVPALFALTPLFTSGATIESAVMNGAHTTEPGPSRALSSNLGGAEVRLRIWSALPELVLAHPLRGVGPGQFRAEFPPYRDPREHELSTHGYASEVGGEVEHAHSDWLQAFAEFGLIGGLGFAVLLASLAVVALRITRGEPAELGPAWALGPAALALLVNATLHTPLSFEPAPAVLAWTLFGALLGALPGASASVGARLRAGTWTGLALAISLLALAPSALRLIRHGEHLAERQRLAEQYADALASPNATERSRLNEFWLKEGRALRDALEVEPDSPLALSLLASHFYNWEASASTRARARDAWTRTLEHRPHQVSALIGLGLLAEDTETRRDYWQQALELAPGHPVVLSNLARLESLEGAPARALAYLERLESCGHLDQALLRDLGARALLAGRTQLGTSLLARLDLGLDLTRADEALALAKATEQAQGPTLFGDALEATAHRLWGLGNLADDEPGFARTKFRQALKLTRRYLPEGDLPTRLLLAASAALDGDEAEARAELDTLESAAILAADWDELPPRARVALEALGLQAPERAGP